jgi:bifunctional DNA-binding transcriptional regulator/antitoxin component of YhaV-PrlF toxin-antitoxin module
MTAIVIDNTGRLEIPSEIRQQLGLTTDQSLNLEVSNGCIIRQPVGQNTKVHCYETALVLETPSLGSIATLIEDIREQRIQSQLSL